MKKMITQLKTRRGTSKYIAFWEIEKERIYSACLKAAELKKRMKKEPEMYPRSLFGPYCWEGETKGFQVFETDNPKKLKNLSEFWGSDVTLSYQPIKEARIWEINSPKQVRRINLPATSR
ncbi:MAG: hypothetical protein NWE89_02135 [Candidatus Bathyarchaeota archaeon]|nr:hypothetical protein [Candidatus Bathyarchaeota archaeon]